MIKKGFTLVELLAVFVLLAIIFMIAVPNVFKLISKGKSNAFLVSVRQVYKAGNIYRLNELREREEECVYFDFGEDYQIDTLVKNKMYIPIEELELQGDLPKEGEMEVCQDYVSITVSDGDNTVDIGPDGDEHVFDGNLEESNVSRPVIDSVNTSKTTKSITTTVTAHDDKNDIVKYYYYLNGELKQSIDSNVYEFTDLKDNTSYKIKIVVENSKGLKTSQNITVKTDELESPEIETTTTGWQKQKTVRITYPSGNNLSYQYKINSGEITGTDEKEKWLTTTSRYKYVYYITEGSISARVSDGVNEKVVTYNVIEVDGILPEITIEPTIVEGENGWLTMVSIKGTITKKGPSQVKLYRCLSTNPTYTSSSYVCFPDDIVEDGSSLVLSSNSNYQKVCYQAINGTGMKTSVICSDSYHVDTGPNIVAKTDEVKVCLKSEEDLANSFDIKYGPSKGESNCTVSYRNDEEYVGNVLTCVVTGGNGKTVSETTKALPLGCYVNYTPDNATWDATRDGVAETVVETQGKFNIYDKIKNEDGNEIGSANGKNKNENISCYSSYKPKYSGWRIMDIDSKGQITLIHGGVPECYYHRAASSKESKEILKVRATSALDEGTGKAWTKYGNSELAESIHYMDSDDVNTILYELNGNEEYNLFDYLVRADRGSCYNRFTNCGSTSELINIDTSYYLAAAVDMSDLISWDNGVRYWRYSYNSSIGVRPVIVLKPNVKLGQESGLKGDEYSLIVN